jgi:hypothetical protein
VRREGNRLRCTMAAQPKFIAGKYQRGEAFAE